MNTIMDAFLQICGLTQTQKILIEEKEPDLLSLSAASYEDLKEKEIPDDIIKSFITGRQAISLEDCQKVLKEENGNSK